MRFNKWWCKTFHQWAWIPKTWFGWINGTKCWWCLESHALERRGYKLGYDQGGNPFYMKL